MVKIRWIKIWDFFIVVIYDCLCGVKFIMPYYDYRCQDCGRKLSLFYKTYREYDQATHRCPHCESTALTRLISRVAIGKSEDARMESLADEALSGGFDEDDPRSIGRFMRKMGREMGEELEGDLGAEFGEVVDRLETGQAPEDIEKEMPGLADGLGGGEGGMGGEGEGE